MRFDLRFESKSVFTPTIHIPFRSQQFDISGLSDVIMSEENNILSSTKIQEGEIDTTWITGRLWQYNLLDLDYPEIKNLYSFIKSNYIDYMNELGLDQGETYIQCWVNIIRNNGRFIYPHNHADGHSGNKTVDNAQVYSYLSGNLCVQTNNTCTYFRSPFLNKQIIALPNKDGEMIFFPSYVMHWTDPNESDIPRITISFDIITKEFYNLIDGRNYRRLT